MTLETLGIVLAGLVWALLIGGLLMAAWFCVIAIRAHGTRPRPRESADQYMARGCLIWGFLLVVLAVIAWAVILVVYGFIER